MKYVIELDFQLTGESGYHKITVEAGGVHTSSDWLIFNRSGAPSATTVAAVFPKDRVISAVVEGQ